MNRWIRWRKVKMEAEKNAVSSGKKLEAAFSSVPECAWATAGSPNNNDNTSNIIMLIKLLGVIFSEYSDQGPFENRAKPAHSLLHESHGPGSVGDAPRI
jgi:hypothetical protein